MKRKIICFVLLIVISVVFLSAIVERIYYIALRISDINSLDPSLIGYNELIRLDYEALTRNTLWAIAFIVGLICSIIAISLIFKKDLVATGSSIVEQWHTYKQAKAERKAAKTAEQKQARIAELEKQLNALKKDE